MAPSNPRITVIAGVNGAGKSSIAGEYIRDHGSNYFNPDERAADILLLTPEISQEGANSQAWHDMVNTLRKAVAARLDYAFETTLGGNTITGILRNAANAGMDVAVWYVGLRDIAQHVERVAARVRAGGHDIPFEKIAQRYKSSRENLLVLLPNLAELRLFDNSAEHDPAAGQRPEPMQILHVRHGQIRHRCAPAQTPTWAETLVAEALKLWGKPTRTVTQKSSR